MEIKLSSELNEIFKLTSGLVKESKNVITFKALIYGAVNYYYRSSKKAEEMDFPPLKSALNKLGPSEIIDFLEIMDNFYKESVSDIFASKTTIFDPELVEFFDKLKATTSPEIINNYSLDTGVLIVGVVGGYSDIQEVFESKLGLTIPNKQRLRENLLDMLEKMFNESISNGNGSTGGAVASDDKEDGSNNFEKYGESDAIHTRKVDPSSTTPVLDEHGVDMTEMAKNNSYDSVIGRDKECNQLIEILCCRKKNNAMILADAGVGKTSLVELLAQKIAAGDVPEELKEKRIISLSSTNLTAGTTYRGQLEEKVQRICEEAKENKNVIIYIDEFQSATSEGSSSSIAQMLKPSLSRGELSLIASTTVDEYKKFIEKDGALKRRFQKVYINEPNGEQTFNILKGISTKYEEYHHVEYSDEVLQACVTWSEKYLFDRHSPDRAIDLMDVVGSYVKVNTTPIDNTELEKAKEHYKELKDSIPGLIDAGDLEAAKKTKQAAIKAAKVIDREKNKYEIEKSKCKKYKITLEDVAKIVSDLSNVPVEKIMNPDIEKLRLMKDDLKSRVIGQDEAIDVTTKLLSRQFLGIRDENIPPSLLMVGPTGSGKTLLAETIAETIFGDKKAMLRVDCGELTEPHTVTKLLGAPPSYVGFGEVALFDQIRERPNQVVLIDEFEKAADNIINSVFLNILTTGFVKLNNGVQVSFKDCIFIFTGNEGTKDLELHGNGIGFNAATTKEEIKKDTEDVVMNALKKRMRPEVINRFSGIVVFNKLDKEDMGKIFYIELGKLQKRFKKKGLDLTVSDKVRDLVVENVDTTYGARDLVRCIGNYIEDPICDAILNSSIVGKSKVFVDLNKEKTPVVKFKK